MNMVVLKALALNLHLPDPHVQPGAAKPVMLYFYLNKIFYYSQNYVLFCD